MGTININCLCYSPEKKQILSDEMRVDCFEQRNQEDYNNKDDLFSNINVVKHQSKEITNSQFNSPDNFTILNAKHANSNAFSQNYVEIENTQPNSKNESPSKQDNLKSSTLSTKNTNTSTNQNTLRHTKTRSLKRLYTLEKVKNSVFSVDRDKFIFKFTTQRLFMTESRLEIFDKENCTKYGIDLGAVEKLEVIDNVDDVDSIVYDPGTVQDSYLYFGSVSKTFGYKKGFGVQLFSNGQKYEGYWDNDKYNLYGRYIDIYGVLFEGNFVDGNFTGLGREVGEEYEFFGQFENFKRHGKGKLVTTNYELEGDFVNNEADGKGKMKIKNELVYTGEFKNNTFHGQGIIDYENGDVFTGSFKNGVFEGKGEIVYAESNEKYIGMFKNGLRHGQGTMYRNDEPVYIGEYSNNLPHGTGTVIRHGKSELVFFNMGIVQNK